MNDTLRTFSHYWWLVFPAMWMVFGLARMIMRMNYDTERLRILKSYADQGKDIPEILRRDPYC